jgi:AraC-like DNA-binding protein
MAYSDPDEYAAAVRGTSLELTVTECGQFAGKVIRIDLHDLWLQFISENLSPVGHSSLTPGRSVVSFWTGTDTEAHWNGVPVLPSQIVWHKESEQFYRRTEGLSERAALSLPIEKMTDCVATMLGCQLQSTRRGRAVTPRAAAMTRLQRLHSAARELAGNAPEVIANREAARGLEQALIGALLGCLDTAEVGENSSAHRRHELIMRRFHRVIQERPEEAIYIPDLCARVGVPERTLRLCCQESLGMGPKRYLLLRRMNLARQALRRADMTTATVTGVVAEFGFWNFGRFAVEYKRLYNEMPSTTLRAPMC